MIRLIKPYVTFSDVETSFAEIFQSGQFSKGHYIAQLEATLTHRLNCQYAFTTSSATTALSTALAVLGVGHGDEVIIADFSFPATANVVENCGATPVFADVDLHTYNLQLSDLENKYTARTKAVIFVSCFGNPTGLCSIKQWCQQQRLWLIEDAACAIGSDENNQPCGSIADLSCFSFHPRKLITAGEGGAITTNNEHLAKQLKVLLNHGASGSQNNIALDFIVAGYNYRLSELQAAMILAQLPKLNDIIIQRNKVRQQYIHELASLGFIPQAIADNVTFNCQSVVFKVPTTINRDQLVLTLREKQIETTLGTYCLSATPYYQQKYQSIQPNARRLQTQTITLPCFKDVPVDQVVDAIKEYL
ncbi:DegT/DnrJ/EryC1/StrS family aminotransferase [Endozoicomonas sp. SM1973]|uniref:DegT/DnrJ/EryC1/StrS family aminotransferase n=1 Tax=Spartinivicinus marinus TaxID=2994442 RepID=A0A853HUB5_9GAMM|nr:DegT/DnrJ/EryC1/StrS family aminotransferase [Spartinivicinus marinus]MCX4029893.1 DegT/DnrJ/EryC1/StrS family aminotransferase [Spartinivicinus marinus]NYZ64863.1 DegT/DnrJ/EryC1/StrS family aminotransferase [Spartinivicinus marinus]